MSSGLPINKNRRHDRDPDAYAEGRAAWDGAQSLDHNPYPRGTTEHREWSRGWRKANKESRSR